MGAGKIAATIVLIAATAAALFFAVKRLSPDSEVKPSPFRDEVALMDIKSGTLMTKPRSEWEKLGEKDGMFLNPVTNQYTMVAVMRCGGCGAKIPRPSPPYEAVETGADPLAMVEWQGALQCPKCGKNPFEMPDPVEKTLVVP